MITDKLRDDEDTAAIENDWKFAAMVILTLSDVVVTNILVIVNIVTIFILIILTILIILKIFTKVLDRLCLITFTAFTIIATIAVLAAAPHVIVT